MKYGLIGEHLPHSFSAEIHAQIGNYPYEILELEPNKVEDFIRSREFCGINVTIPYKEKVIPMLDFVDPAALKIGAVNTVVNRSGKLYGYNTDYSGMKALVEKIGLDVKGKKVLVIGKGGTGKTAKQVLTDMGAGELVFASRHEGVGTATYGEVYRHHTDCELVFNTSPVGMYPSNDGIPLDLEAFPRLEGVLDAVYNPIRTSLVQKALELGVLAEGGLYMLAAQAVYASGHFFGGSVDNSLIDKVYKSVLSMKDNLVLTGMPSSGKTTVGKLLAEKTNKTFVDTDDEIVKRIGMSIPKYFEKLGEVEFRKIESEVIKKVSALGNCVIATGGGAVLNCQNVKRLKQNGKIYFLDRSLDLLCPTSDRPLSNSRADMEKRYKERYDIYLEAADVKINGNGSAEEVTEEIYKEYTK